MKRIITVCAIILLFVTPIFALDSLSTIEFSEQVAELGIPTIESVKLLEDEANKLYESKDWKNAAEKFENLAKQSNFMANIIAKGIEPYYSASYDARKSFPYYQIKKISPDESLSNHYKNIRNVSFLRRGICFYNLNEFDASIPLLMKALDLLSIDDESLWNEARFYLYKIIGYSGYSVL